MSSSFTPPPGGPESGIGESYPLGADRAVGGAAGSRQTSRAAMEMRDLTRAVSALDAALQQMAKTLQGVNLGGLRNLTGTSGAGLNGGHQPGTLWTPNAQAQRPQSRTPQPQVIPAGASLLPALTPHQVQQQKNGGSGAGEFATFAKYMFMANMFTSGMQGAGNLYNNPLALADPLRRSATSYMNGGAAFNESRVSDRLKTLTATTRGSEDTIGAMTMGVHRLGFSGVGGRGREEAAMRLSRGQDSFTGGATLLDTIMDPTSRNRLRGLGLARDRSDFSGRGAEDYVERVLDYAAGGKASLKNLHSSSNSYFRYNLRQMLGSDEAAEQFIKQGLAARGQGPSNDPALRELNEATRNEQAWSLKAGETVLQQEADVRGVLSDIRDAIADPNGLLVRLGGVANGMFGNSAMNLASNYLIHRAYAQGTGGGSGGGFLGGFGGAWKGNTGKGPIGRTAAAARGGWGAMSAASRFTIGGLLSLGAMKAGESVGEAAGLTEEQGRELKGWRGAGAGALKYGAFGAAAGSFVPGAGTLIGGAIGTGVGAIAGSLGFGVGDPPQTEGLLLQRTGKDASHVTGMNSQFKHRLERMFAANPKLVLVSGYRSPEHQKRLFDDAVKKYGSEAAARKHVAPPGKSNHNKGLAADIGPSSEYAWIKQNAGKYGLEVPMSWEPWHVEPRGLRSGKEQIGLEIAGQPSATLGASASESKGTGGLLAGTMLAGGERAMVEMALGRGMSGVAGSHGAGGAVTGSVSAAGTGSIIGLGKGSVGAIDQFLQGLRTHESNNNYRAESPYSSASGAYQYIDGTWNGYKGYKRAKDAPPSVQDERARKDILGYFNKYGNWAQTAAHHFYPALADEPDKWNTSPGKGNPTIQQYVNAVLSKAGMGDGMGDPPTDGGPRGGGGNTVVNQGGAKTVHIHMQVANGSDARRVAREVVRLLQDEQDFAVLGGS